LYTWSKNYWTDRKNAWFFLNLIFSSATLTGFQILKLPTYGFVMINYCSRSSRHNCPVGRHDIMRCTNELIVDRGVRPIVVFDAASGFHRCQPQCLSSSIDHRISTQFAKFKENFANPRVLHLITMPAIILFGK
jgi:hypothetical protein